MPRQEAYRRFAKECLEMARSTKDERTRATFLQMAQIWARLAEEKADAASEQSD